MIFRLSAFILTAIFSIAANAEGDPNLIMPDMRSTNATSPEIEAINAVNEGSRKLKSIGQVNYSAATVGATSVHSNRKHLIEDTTGSANQDSSVVAKPQDGQK